jgi:hypothetical protein
MAVNLSFIGGAGWQFFTDNGIPLAGGKIYRSEERRVGKECE